MERSRCLDALEQAGKTCKAISSCCSSGIGQILFPAETNESVHLSKAKPVAAGRYAEELEAQWFKQVAQGQGHGGPGRDETAEPGTGTESETNLPEDTHEEPENSASDESDRLPAESMEKLDVGRSLLELLRSGPSKPSAAEGTLSTGTGSVDSSSESQEQRDEPTLQVPLLQGVAGFSSELWDYLVRPLMDSRHSKAFVGHDVFRGSPIPGSRPQVLVDRRKDTDIMAMFKPSGWATCSTPQWEGLEGNLIRHVWCYYNAPTAAPCHRLDKGTSGIVLVATSKIASKHICQQILNKTLVKQYVGLCHGLVTPGMGVFSAPLALSRADRPLGACSTEGREAVTRYRVLGYFRGSYSSYSLVQVQIEHGRQHQIRLHMASLGHPIVADSRYNPYKAKDDAEICPRLFLHACYLRCSLLLVDSEEPEPFTVACNLPAELRRVLVSELELDRSGSSQLPLDAQQLCDTLLFPEDKRICRRVQTREDIEELHESRLALRRRDEFMNRFGFNAKERAEILRILNQLKTSKERSAALHQFRVLGQRTPDFIVGRFAKYVEGLLRWNQNHKSEDVEVRELSNQTTLGLLEVNLEDRRCGEASMENERPVIEAVESSSQECELLRCLRTPPEKETPENETLRVDGPLQILTESVWCDVCGLTEKQISVCTGSLTLKCREPGILGKRTPCQPVRRRRYVRDVRKWTAKAGGRAQVTEEAEQESEDDECEEVDEEDEDDEVDDVEDSEAEEETVASSSVTSRRWMSRSAQTRCVTPLVIKAEGEPPSNERLNQVVDLEEKTRALVQGHGGSVDGVWLAGKVAAEFNLYVRENSKRNDGSLKKWLMSTPGLVVENAKQQNNWSVRLA
ncbi:unnamed protein product [Cladocopium goreaui]|uniref:Pseudouridine synthase RsuA/RluA-like domain-containing protein n=1 Tax=Cladocopium goreaui TaxID=2562237 RepID=A0A9P1FYF2_9DINO|nr:unnamed protein product [Cladocopium goreaui]